MNGDETVTATVMFTDLVGSTELASRLGPVAADDFRRAHLHGVEAAVTSHGGRVVKNLGDGIMASFASANAGVQASAAVQTLAGQLEQSVEHPVRFRVGIANGDVVSEHGDLFGEPVVEAARLCNAAEPGQILATDLVRMLVASRGHEFHEVGMLQLKGLPDPVLAVELAWKRASPARPLPHQLVQRGLGFAGRHDERQLFRDQWKAIAHSGLPGAIVINGETGAGKTALATTVAEEFHETGATVVFGGADAELTVPYGPWVDAVVHLLQHRTGQLPGSAGELVRLGPRVAPLLDGRTATPSDAETERYLLQGAVADLLVSSQPILVVLDDVQWADRESLVLLRRLLGTETTGQLLVIATQRTGEPPSDDFAACIAMLRRLSNVSWIDLSPLATRDVIDLMETVAGHPLDPVGAGIADMVTEESGGNAFFAVELLRNLADTGSLRPGPDGRWIADRRLQHLGLPAGIKDVVRQRTARLGDAARTVLQALAVAGTAVDLDVLASVTSLPAVEVADALDAATHAALVRESSDIPVRFDFSHAIIARTITDDMGSARRQLLHGRYAKHFEQSPGTSAALLAHHWLHVGSDPARARDHAIAAGREALTARAPAQAAQWFRRALDLPTPEPARRLDLLLDLANAQKQSGDNEHRSSIVEVAREAQRLASDHHLIQAALLTHRGSLATSLGEVDEEIVALVRAALASPQCGGSERARLLAQLGNELLYAPGTFHERKRLVAEAAALAESSGDDRTIAYALTSTTGAGTELDGVEERQASGRKAIAAARRVGDPTLLFWALHAATINHVAAGGIDDVRQWTAEMEQLSEALGLPIMRFLVLGQHSELATLEGDLDRAESTILRSMEIAGDTGYQDSFLLASIQLMLLRMHQGRLHELETAIADALAATPAMVALRPALAIAALLDGRTGPAEQMLAEFDVEMTGFGNPNYTSSLALWSETALALSDARVSGLILPLVSEHPEALVCNGWTTHGVLRHHEATLLRVLGRFDEADAAFADALRLHEELEAPYLVASTLLRWGEMLVDEGIRPDEGADLVERADGIAKRHGYGFWRSSALRRAMQTVDHVEGV